MELKKLGWNGYFEAQFAEFKGNDLLPARVSLQLKKQYRVIAEQGEYDAVIVGKIRHKAESLADFPVIGDWVLVKINPDGTALIHHILPRRTKISRDTTTRKGRQQIADEQVLVSNVDTIFVVTALNEELNPRRIERYLTVIWDSGATPVLILNKADLCENVEEAVEIMQDVAIGVDVHVMSATENDGVEILNQYLADGKTVALLGSSGVGKSTIINQLLGEEKFKVADIGDYKDKGRHTTTHRELVLMDRGGILIDNPGIRSLQLWDGEEGISKSFEDIEEFSEHCRFNDCKHINEPDCAVLAAVESGELDQDRYDSYLKLQGELSYRARKENWVTRQNTKKRWKTIAKVRRQINKRRGEDN